MVHADPGIPCLIGNRVTVGHRVILHGCVVEDECLIGMGAILLNRVKVGTGSVIGAGDSCWRGWKSLPARWWSARPPGSSARLMKRPAHGSTASGGTASTRPGTPVGRVSDPPALDGGMSRRPWCLVARAAPVTTEPRWEFSTVHDVERRSRQDRLGLRVPAAGRVEPGAARPGQAEDGECRRRRRPSATRRSGRRTRSAGDASPSTPGVLRSTWNVWPVAS